MILGNKLLAVGCVVVAGISAGNAGGYNVGLAVLGGLGAILVAIEGMTNQLRQTARQ